MRNLTATLCLTITVLLGSAVKKIEFALTRKDSKIDTDELWKRAARSFQRDVAPPLDLIGLFANIAD